MKSPTNHYITGFKKERPTNTSPTGLDSPRFSWNIKFSCRSQGQCVGTSRFTRWHTRRVRLRDAHTHALARCGAGTITGREGGGGMADIRLVIVMLDGWTLCLDLRYCNKYCSIKNKVLNSHRCHSNMCIYIYIVVYIYIHAFFWYTLCTDTLSTLYYMVFTFCSCCYPLASQIDIRVLVTFWPEVHFWHFKSKSRCSCCIMFHV